MVRSLHPGVGHSRPADLAVAGGRLVLPGGVVRSGTVLVDGGTIAAILPSDASYTARRRIDASGKYVLPGLIDSHVHFRVPGLTHKEDWAHASRAAAAGGVTTVLDMPNTKPPLFDPALVAAKASLVQGESLVDYAFHLGVDPHDPSRLAEVDLDVVCSAKLFMCGHHTAPFVLRDPAVLDAAFSAAAEAGVRLLTHAEDDGVFELLDNWRGPVRSAADFEPARPRTGAIVAVAKIIDLVRRHGTAVHVLHVSSAEEADLLAAAAAADLPITFEVTPHHLAFSNHDVVRLGSRIRLSPAIREPADRERLWASVFRQEAAAIGGDHAPHPVSEKLKHPADAPPGMPGVQELLPSVFTGMRRRQPEVAVEDHLSLLAELVGANPARLYGLESRKGRIAVGLDADLAVFDAEQPWMFGARDVRSKCGWSSYEGWLMAGKVTMTVRRGEVIWDDADGSFGDPAGEWVRPSGVTGPARLDRAA